jgi:hypothetical protein
MVPLPSKDITSLTINGLTDVSVQQGVDNNYVSSYSVVDSNGNNFTAGT